MGLCFLSSLPSCELEWVRVWARCPASALAWASRRRRSFPCCCLNLLLSTLPLSRVCRKQGLAAIKPPVRFGPDHTHMPPCAAHVPTPPSRLQSLIAKIKANTPGADNVIISTHCQNDLGLSTANSLAGAMGGARQVGRGALASSPATAC